MGRRALPKLNPTVDWSWHHLTLDQVNRPLYPEHLFGRAGPFDVEIGSGKGLFLQSASALHPERNYLGIEISAKYARFAAYRLARQNRNNARVIHGDGLSLFADYLADSAVDSVHVYFPDPWWKARHRKRRVMRASLVADIERVLKPGGDLLFWTDVEEYFETTCSLIGSRPALQPMAAGEEPDHGESADYRTHFERRMRLNDHPVFRARFQKPSAIKMG
jgi:tRNA (guanine-N7-)-methyltransferase